MLRSLVIGLTLTAWSVSAHGLAHHRRQVAEAQVAAQQALEALVSGNSQFRQNTDPALLQRLTDDGQKPSFAFIGCSDSRVNENVIFNQPPGTFFTERNIANVYSAHDTSAQSFMAYGTTVLGVKHVVVVGHYGCGGVAASIASRPNPTKGIELGIAAVEAWIDPIRNLYETSTRPEIVALREKNAALEFVPEPEFEEPGFRALVEENAKASATQMHLDPIIQDRFAKISAAAAGSLPQSGAAHARKRAEEAEGEHLAPLLPVFIHTWVYDIRTGEIKDLEHSFGPPGFEVPTLASLLKSPVTANTTLTAIELPAQPCEIVAGMKLCQASSEAK